MWNKAAENSKTLTTAEKCDIDKFEHAQVRWWIYTPTQLRELERKAYKAYAKLEKELQNCEQK